MADVRALEKTIIYFIQVQPAGPIKIGCTTMNVVQRLATLQECCPYELRWIGYLPGSRAKERQIHKRFSTARIRSEWFDPVPELTAYIQESCPTFDVAKARDELFFERERQLVKIYLAGGSRQQATRRRELLQRADISAYDLQAWLKSRKLPRSETISAIMNAIKIAQFRL